MAIADQLTSINNSKQAIKTAIEAKGVTVGTAPLDQYASKITAISSGSTGPTPDTWTRNTEWLTMPTVSSSENKVVILFAVYPNTSAVRLWIRQVDNVSGSWTVDWGDGTTTTSGSSNNADHTYDYTNTHFDGTLTSKGYKQAIITITPSTNPLNNSPFYMLDFSMVNGLIYASSTISSNYLDMIISAPNANNILIGSSSNTTRHTLLERIQILSCANNVNMDYVFRFCYALRSISLPNVTISTAAFMFNTCRKLQEVPALTINLGTTGNLTSMFQNCYDLIKINGLTITAGNNTRAADNMFNSCYSLYTIPLFNTGNINSAQSMFQSCINLTTIPQFDFSKMATTTSMFNTCYSMRSYPALDFSASTSLGSIFSQNWSLLTAPTITTTTALTNTASMFSGCLSLRSVSLFTTSAVVNMSGMFDSCYQLETIPAFTTSAATNMSSMFNACNNLDNIPTLSTSACTNMSVMFNGCNALKTIPALTMSALPSSVYMPTYGNQTVMLQRNQSTGAKFTHTYLNCGLSAAALNEIYTNLATVTGQTITVTGNWGTATDDPTIATSRGWTVSG